MRNRRRVAAGGHRIKWAGRLAVLGAVAFWWGGYVLPYLVSVALPDVVPRKHVPWWLDADMNGSLTNTMSAAVLGVGAVVWWARVIKSGSPVRKNAAMLAFASRGSERAASTLGVLFAEGAVQGYVLAGSNRQHARTRPSH